MQMKQDICYHRAVPHELYHRSTTQTIPQEYHTLVTTGRYYMLMLLHDKCMYHTCRSSTTLLLPQDSATRLLPHDITTHVTTVPHRICVVYSDTMHAGLIGILPQRSDRHYHMDHLDIVPHRSDRLATHI